MLNLVPVIYAFQCYPESTHPETLTRKCSLLRLEYVKTSKRMQICKLQSTFSISQNYMKWWTIALNFKSPGIQDHLLQNIKVVDVHSPYQEDHHILRYHKAPTIPQHNGKFIYKTKGTKSHTQQQQDMSLN